MKGSGFIRKGLRVVGFRFLGFGLGGLREFGVLGFIESGSYVSGLPFRWGSCLRLRI